MNVKQQALARVVARTAGVNRQWTLALCLTSVKQIQKVDQSCKYIRSLIRKDYHRAVTK